MKNTIPIIFSILVFYNFLFSQFDHKKEYEEFEYNCSTCHECKNPTKNKPCLKSCPRFELITIYHSAEEGPGTITMNGEYLGPDLYNEVIFSHKAHAEMSDIAGGCAMCHHNNPPGRILSCKSCHEIERQRTDITKPDLKGAYHQQCIECHQKWEHATECESCHSHISDVKNEKIDGVQLTTKRIHPKVEEPSQLIYDTDTDEGIMVTFYHNEHVHLFGLECSDCHSNESCINCHDTDKEDSDEFIAVDEHERCSKCHEVEEQCEFCHSNEIKPAFNHTKRSGFSLNKYHKTVSCGACHDKDKNYANVNKNCLFCHKSWNNENFNHKVTGLVLDENHIENDCEDCHIDKKFNEKPTCDNCHDEITYPNKLPGKM